MEVALSSFKSFTALHAFPSERLFAGRHRPPSTLLLSRHSLATSTIALSRRLNRNSSSSSSKKKKKNSSSEDMGEEEDDMDDDAFEALFRMLEEDLKKDGSPIADDDDDISEEDFDKLQRALEEALGIDDDDNVEILNSAENHVEDDNDIEEGEEERPVKLKNWQLKRLARALKNGRRKTSIKSLAAELCLDRAIVLELLRDPPPHLVMMSAALPDENPTFTPSTPEGQPLFPEEPETVDDEKSRSEKLRPVPLSSFGEPLQFFPEEPATVVESKSEKEVPVHIMRHRWSAQKRLKKVHIATLERVYKRTKRPTNAMISSIVQVTNLPRKRIVKWFEDKRNEDGVPDHHRLPYQRRSSRGFLSNDD